MQFRARARPLSAACRASNRARPLLAKVHENQSESSHCGALAVTRRGAISARVKGGGLVFRANYTGTVCRLVRFPRENLFCACVEHRRDFCCGPGQSCSGQGCSCAGRLWHLRNRIQSKRRFVCVSRELQFSCKPPPPPPPPRARSLPKMCRRDIQGTGARIHAIHTLKGLERARTRARTHAGEGQADQMLTFALFASSRSLFCTWRQLRGGRLRRFWERAKRREEE